MKVIVQVCVLFAIVAVAYSASSTWGVRNATDTVILNTRVFHPAVRNVVQTFYFDIPASYQSNNKVISAIYLDDQFQNSTGPVNTLVAGGPGWTFASVQMRTQNSLGLNVTFIVYDARWCCGRNVKKYTITDFVMLCFFGCSVKAFYNDKDIPVVPIFGLSGFSKDEISKGSKLKLEKSYINNLLYKVKENNMLRR